MKENKKPRNPNAFPKPPETSCEFNEQGQTVGCQDGMTLRDYFAAKAMQSVLSSKHYDSYVGNNGLPVPDFIAKEAYEIADAMLKQREL